MLQIRAVRRVSAVALLLPLGMLLSAWAGPMLNRGQDLPDPVRSLAGVRSIRIVLEPLPDDLRTLGVDENTLVDRIEQVLRRGAIEPVGDDDAPRLHVLLMGMQDASLAEGMGFIFSARLHQRVQVARLGQQLDVPTYAVVGGSIDTRRNVAESVHVVLDSVIGQFTEAVRRATAAAP